MKISVSPPDESNGIVNTQHVKDKEEKQDTFSFFKVSREKMFLLLCMGFLNFCATTCFSLLVPFFPNEVGNVMVNNHRPQVSCTLQLIAITP